MGKMETLTPVKSKPLNILTHNLSGLITSTRWTFVPNLVKIRSRGTFGQRGEIIFHPYIIFTIIPQYITAILYLYYIILYFEIYYISKLYLAIFGLFVWLFYLFIFSRTNVEKRPLDGFWRAMPQKTRNRARMCLFGVIKWKIEIWPLFTPNPPPKKKWPWIGNFQPKWWNMKLQVYQKVLNQSRWKFNTMLGT